LLYHLPLPEGVEIVTARVLIEALDNAQLHTLRPGDWSGFFEGQIAIQNVEERGDVIRFDVLIPTSSYDVEDFIRRSEREQGTTQKAALVQGAQDVPGARVIGVLREGPDARWHSNPTHQYRLRFSAPITAVRPEQPLALHLRWPDQETEMLADVAIASGR
jgi:hypothetical protein